MGAIKTKTKFQATRKRSKAALDLQCRDRHKWTNQNGRTGSAIRKPVEGCQPRHCECVCWLRRQSKHRDNEWHTHISSAPLFILEDFFILRQPSRQPVRICAVFMTSHRAKLLPTHWQVGCHTPTHASRQQSICDAIWQTLYPIH